MSYEQSVLRYADDQGNLDADIVDQLLEEHSTDAATLISDGFNPDLICNAQALLNWLGY
jgi:hypothetical protein